MLALADVAVTVSDAKVSAEWWKEKLGFAVHTIGPPGSHAIVVAPPGDRFVLHLCAGFEPVDGGNTGIAFLTDDFAGQVRRMERSGVTFVDPPKSNSRMAKFADPDGNVFWLIGAPTEFIQQELARKAASPAGKARRRSSRRTRKGVST
jgi:catechol 2,3-dioxygenase-like lactoylglutathione lyase family enzyme